jgi:hypothetical protein
MRRMIGTSGGTGETKGLFGINFHAGGCSVSGESDACQGTLRHDWLEGFASPRQDGESLFLGTGQNL